jgi:carbonic anhydrase
MASVQVLAHKIVRMPRDDDVFDDVLKANASYAKEFSLAGLAARAGQGLAIVTCMDSRIEPLTMLGLKPGDAKILRNAGARVTDDVVRTLVLARYLLGVERVMVVAHTKCRMAGGTEEDVHAAIADAGGPDTSELSFLVTEDQVASLREDVDKARGSAYLKDTVIGGFLYDVDTGLVSRIC